MISNKAFEKISGLVHAHAGIQLTDAKKQLVVSRLAKRLRHLNLDDYEEYHDVCVSCEVELQTMINTITTNETSFFREPKHFEFLRNDVLNEVFEGRFRVWSAAASIGAEAYSTAMVLDDELSSRGIDWEVVGTDINTEVIEQASLGLYPIRFADQIHGSYLKKYCLKGVGSKDGQFLINDYLKNKVSFKTMNLMNQVPSEMGQFDVIFLRNMLIYFDNENKKKIVHNVCRALKNGGYLFIGHAESITHLVSRGIRQVRPTIYIKDGVL